MNPSETAAAPTSRVPSPSARRRALTRCVRRGVALPVAVPLALLFGGACDDPDTRNCPLEGRAGADVYDLEYELLIPADCPVPIGAAGETKRAGAYIRDGGVAQFDYAVAFVKNSAGQVVGDDYDFFSFIPGGGGETEAEPTTLYQAATTGTLNLDNRYDYGYFEVTNDLNRVGSGPHGEVRITYARSVMTNVIDGTPIPPRNSTVTWRAAVTGGTPPYSYYWYRDGTLVGTSEYYTGTTGTQNFGLKAAVVDQTMTERVAVMPVDVGGALVAIDGPDWAYLYTYDVRLSNATWTAVVHGGTAPFTYRWYRDGYLTGSTTSSHTEHIDERVDFILRVEVTDANGKTALDQKFVRVGQKDCATCPAY